MRISPTACVCLLAIFSVGCHPDAEVVSDDLLPQAAVQFTGKPDSRFAGHWKTEDGVSDYRLDAAGTYKLESTIKVQGQTTIHSHLSGSWSVDGDRILFKDQAGNVAAYAYDLHDNKLTLTTTGSLKGKTVMDRVLRG